MVTRRTLLAGTGLGLGAGLLSGCGLGTSGGYSPTGRLVGTLASIPTLDGTHLSVGSKSFTEQLVLGKIAVILFQSAGATVSDLTGIPGSSSARRAMVDGEVDMEWEYTGTAWISYLGHDDAIPDEKKQFAAVAAADRANGLAWLTPAPMNNTYGFAVTRARAKALGISRLSQLSQVPQASRTFCIESEFRNRNDGLEPMLKKYDVPLGQGVRSNQLKVMDTGAVYDATARGLCTFGEVFTTDGRIKALDLVVLEDDRHYFPNYNVAPVLREPVLQQHSQLRTLFAPVTAALTDQALMTMNAAVDVQGKEPVDVAWQWLVDKGFIASR